MEEHETTKKKFSQSRKDLELLYLDITKDVENKIDHILDKTYKQFEKTYDANLRKSE
jgi:hypothetical protein